jgi:hypothetical protein
MLLNIMVQVTHGMEENTIVKNISTFILKNMKPTIEQVPNLLGELISTQLLHIINLVHFI